MGGGQSQPARATHFNRSEEYEPPKTDTRRDRDDDDRPHINISNKMVERLVEDATLTVGAAAAVAKAAEARGLSPPGDHKDNIFVDKLRRLDEHHSEKYGLTVEEINALAKRVELRTEGMMSPAAVCEEQEAKVIECYNQYREPDQVARCWDTVGVFSKCVKDAATERLRARGQKEAREHARKSRHMAHARDTALKDLGMPDGI